MDFKFLNHEIGNMPSSYKDCDVTVSETPITSKPSETPSYYRLGDVQAWDVIEMALRTALDPYEGFLVGNIMKYILRYKYKGGSADLDKAVKYIHKLKQHKYGLK